MPDLKKKDWCTDKDPWRWERCGDCGVIIGKDYGSFSHMCEQKRKRLAKLKEKTRQAAVEFKERLTAAETWPMRFVNDDKSEATREIPILKKRVTSWQVEECEFTAPLYVEASGRLYRLSNERGRVTFKGQGYTEYYEIVPDVVL